MLSIIVKAVFTVVSKLAAVFLTVAIAPILALFPDLTGHITNISHFFELFGTYVHTACNLMLIPDSVLALLFGYFAIKYSIHVIAQTVTFAITAYDKLKT